MKKQHSLMVFVLLFCLVLPVWSAPDYSLKDSLIAYQNKARFGIYGQGGYNLHISDFQGLPGVSSCCPKFDIGMAPSFALGALFEKPINNKFGFAARATFLSLGGKFEATESEKGIIDNDIATIEYTHYLNTQISVITFEPMLLFKPIANLNLYAGGFAGIIHEAKYSQYEEITSPSDRGSFIDRRRIRNENEGDIGETSPFVAGVTLGISYDLMLNRTQSLILSPELFYRANIMPPIPDVFWMTNSISAGIALKFKKAPPPPPPPADPMQPVMPELNMPNRLSDYNIALKTTQIDASGKESDHIDVRIEDFVSYNFRPLLAYIFFDKNSDNISERYLKLTKSQTHIYSLENLSGLDALQTYYHVLNIYGSRMRKHPNTKIALTGTNANVEEESKNKNLSMRRAQAVKRYLVQVWGINEERIAVNARNLPKKPAFASDNPEYAHQENRRVEITSADPELNEPVITNDTKRIITATTIRFYPELKGDANIKNWKIIAKQNGKPIFQKKADGALPEYIDWKLIGDDAQSLTTSGEIAYHLETVDDFGRKETTGIVNLPVEQMTIQKKRKQKIKDKEFEYYSLILFDYGKSELGREHKKVVDYVKSRTKEEATVYVKGYTDMKGEEAVNKRIAEKRARAVGRRLNIPSSNIIGVGESAGMLFDNDLPEGRYYCRTVQIEIEIEVD